MQHTDICAGGRLQTEPGNTRDKGVNPIEYTIDALGVLRVCERTYFKAINFETDSGQLPVRPPSPTGHPKNKTSSCLVVVTVVRL